MVEELERHGYHISPGTLYPLLHGLESKGYLRGSAKQYGRSRRTVYRITLLGGKAPAAARNKVRDPGNAGGRTQTMTLAPGVM
jgi:DNA-binding PadR family transcriptional regulator